MPGYRRQFLPARSMQRAEIAGSSWQTRREEVTSSHEAATLSPKSSWERVLSPSASLRQALSDPVKRQSLFSDFPSKVCGLGLNQLSCFAVPEMQPSA